MKPIIRLTKANKYHYSLLKQFQTKPTKSTPKKSKNILYTSYLRPILLYGYETRSTNKGNHLSEIIFKRKIIGKICSLLYNKTELYERKHNNKL